MFLPIVFISFTVFLLHCSWYSSFFVCYFFRTIKMIFFSFLMKDPCFCCFCSDSLHLFFDFFATVLFIFLVLCWLHFSHHKNDFFWVLLWKCFAFNVSADSLHHFYCFFASVFFILVLICLLHCFFSDKNDFFWVLYEHSLLLMFRHIFYGFFASVLLLFISWYRYFFKNLFGSLFFGFILLLYWLHFSHHKNDDFWVLLGKFLAFNVFADSLHIFYGFCFSSYLHIVHFLKSFWLSDFWVHLALSFHNFMFISFATNLYFSSNFRSVFFFFLIFDVFFFFF